MGLPNTLEYWQGIHPDPWLWAYWDSGSAPHRQFLADRIAGLAPFDSLLEVGCHCGPNLKRLHEAMPDVKLTGIDPSAQAIRFGRQQPSLAGVTLKHGRMGLDTATWSDRAFDIVMSCYALSYIQPQQPLLDTLRECWRLTAKAFVIFEPMRFDGETECGVNGGYAEFKHPYVVALGTALQTRGALVDVHSYESGDPNVRLNGLVVVRRPV